MANEARRTSSITGSYVSHPEKGRRVVPNGGVSSRTSVRSADGEFVSKTEAAAFASTTVPGGDDLSSLESAYAAGVADPSSPSATATVQQVPTRAGRRSKAADDPLAPERTRWLSDVVGGRARLAEMLGVSASQTSRWAAGQERPGIQVAPLLIDLEHVLARIRLVWAEPAATTWMVSHNAHLGGARPVDVLRLHGPGPVLDALDAGVWGGVA